MTLTAAGLIACSSSPAEVASAEVASIGATAEHVVLVGDSLAEEAAPYLTEMLEPTPITARFFAGTAPCDWLNEDLEITASSVVVVSFSGNSLTACMSDGNGGSLLGLALVERYRLDVTALIERSLAEGADVVLIGQPTNGVSAEAVATIEALNELYTQLAQQLGVSYADAGAEVEAPDGNFASRLACRGDEPECPDSGLVIVRSDDGGHFCPGGTTPGDCPVHSPGAWRFALGIANAVSSAATADGQ